MGIAFKRCLSDPIFKNGFEIFDQFSLKSFFKRQGQVINFFINIDWFLKVTVLINLRTVALSKAILTSQV
jgi:hypothetical protein